MAALFVLVLGYSNAQGFSFAYVLQMGMGVAVGFAVNWLVFPPLHLEGIDPAIDGHQRALSKQLRDMASAMTESWPPDHEEWGAAAASSHVPRPGADSCPGGDVEHQSEPAVPPSCWAPASVATSLPRIIAVVSDAA